MFLDEYLSQQRFVNGDYVALSDIHLFVSLIRFHVTYHLSFGVDKKRLQDYPNLWCYTRDVHQIPAFYDYIKLEWIKSIINYHRICGQNKEMFMVCLVQDHIMVNC